MLPAAAVEKWNASLQEMKRNVEFQSNTMLHKFASMEQRLSHVEDFYKDAKSIPKPKISTSTRSRDRPPQIPRSVYLMSPKPFVTANPSPLDNSSPPPSANEPKESGGQVNVTPTVSECHPEGADTTDNPPPIHEAEALPDIHYVKVIECHAKSATPKKIPTNERQSRESRLRSAAKDGDHHELRSLISSGVDPNAKSDSGHTALHLAITKSHVECVEILLESGADVNEMDKFGQTPLIKASSGGNAECLRLLLDWRARVSLKDHNGRSALHAAAAWGHGECVEELLDAGIPVDERDNGGRTALHVAAAGNRAEAMEALLSAGADKRLKTNDGRTAMDFAVSEHVKFLLWKGA